MSHDQLRLRFAHLVSVLRTQRSELARVLVHKEREPSHVRRCISSLQKVLPEAKMLLQRLRDSYLECGSDSVSTMLRVLKSETTKTKRTLRKVKLLKQSETNERICDAFVPKTPASKVGRVTVVEAVGTFPKTRATMSRTLFSKVKVRTPRLIDDDATVQEDGDEKTDSDVLLTLQPLSDGNDSSKSTKLLSATAERSRPESSKRIHDSNVAVPDTNMERRLAKMGSQIILWKRACCEAKEALRESVGQLQFANAEVRELSRRRSGDVLRLNEASTLQRVSDEKTIDEARFELATMREEYKTLRTFSDREEDTMRAMCDSRRVFEADANLFRVRALGNLKRACEAEHAELQRARKRHHAYEQVLKNVKYEKAREICELANSQLSLRKTREMLESESEERAGAHQEITRLKSDLWDSTFELETSREDVARLINTATKESHERVRMEQELETCRCSLSNLRKQELELSIIHDDVLQACQRAEFEKNECLNETETLSKSFHLQKMEDKESAEEALIAHQIKILELQKTWSAHEAEWCDAVRASEQKQVDAIRRSNRSELDAVKTARREEHDRFDAHFEDTCSAHVKKLRAVENKHAKLLDARVSEYQQKIQRMKETARQQDDRARSRLHDVEDKAAMHIRGLERALSSKESSLVDTVDRLKVEKKRAKEKLSNAEDALRHEVALLREAGQTYRADASRTIKSWRDEYEAVDLASRRRVHREEATFAAARDELEATIRHLRGSSEKESDRLALMERRIAHEKKLRGSSENFGKERVEQKYEAKLVRLRAEANREYARLEHRMSLVADRHDIEIESLTQKLDMEKKGSRDECKSLKTRARQYEQTLAKEKLRMEQLERAVETTGARLRMAEDVASKVGHLEHCVRNVTMRAGDEARAVDEARQTITEYQYEVADCTTRRARLEAHVEGLIAQVTAQKVLVSEEKRNAVSLRHALLGAKENQKEVVDETKTEAKEEIDMIRERVRVLNRTRVEEIEAVEAIESKRRLEMKETMSLVEASALADRDSVEVLLQSERAEMRNNASEAKWKLERVRVEMTERLARVEAKTNRELVRYSEIEAKAREVADERASAERNGLLALVEECQAKNREISSLQASVRAIKIQIRERDDAAERRIHELTKRENQVLTDFRIERDANARSIARQYEEREEISFARARVLHNESSQRTRHVCELATERLSREYEEEIESLRRVNRSHFESHRQDIHHVQGASGKLRSEMESLYVALAQKESEMKGMQQARRESANRKELVTASRVEEIREIAERQVEKAEHARDEIATELEDARRCFRNKFEVTSEAFESKTNALTRRHTYEMETTRRVHAAISLLERHQQHCRRMAFTRLYRSLLRTRFVERTVHRSLALANGRWERRLRRRGFQGLQKATELAYLSELESRYRQQHVSSVLRVFVAMFERKVISRSWQRLTGAARKATRSARAALVLSRWALRERQRSYIQRWSRYCQDRSRRRTWALFALEAVVRAARDRTIRQNLNAALSALRRVTLARQTSMERRHRALTALDSLARRLATRRDYFVPWNKWKRLVANEMRRLRLLDARVLEETRNAHRAVLEETERHSNDQLCAYRNGASRMLVRLAHSVLLRHHRLAVRKRFLRWASETSNLSRAMRRVASVTIRRNREFLRRAIYRWSVRVHARVRRDLRTEHAQIRARVSDLECSQNTQCEELTKLRLQTSNLQSLLVEKEKSLTKSRSRIDALSNTSIRFFLVGRRRSVAHAKRRAWQRWLDITQIRRAQYDALRRVVSHDRTMKMVHAWTRWYAHVSSERVVSSSKRAEAVMVDMLSTLEKKQLAMRATMKAQGKRLIKAQSAVADLQSRYDAARRDAREFKRDAEQAFRSQVNFLRDLEDERADSVGRSIRRGCGGGA